MPKKWYTAQHPIGTAGGYIETLKRRVKEGRESGELSEELLAALEEDIARREATLTKYKQGRKPTTTDDDRGR